MTLIKPVQAAGGQSSGTSNIGGQVEDFFQFTDLGSLITAMINAVIIIGAIAALIYLVSAGLNWITSGGDKAKTESAQKQITNAIIGLIILVAAFAIFNTLITFLGIDEAIITN